MVRSCRVGNKPPVRGAKKAMQIGTLANQNDRNAPTNHTSAGRKLMVGYEQRVKLTTDARDPGGCSCCSDRIRLKYRNNLV